MNVEVMIPAGGAGKRMGGPSKQYLLLGGIHMLAHTLRVFQGMEDVSRIVLAVPLGDIRFVRDAIVQRYGFSKVSDVVPGGRERQDSVRNGLRVLGQGGIPNDLVIIHDAVRPFITENLVSRAIRACRSHDAVVLGIPVKDTMKEATEKGFVRATLERKGLWMIQTPQVFRKGLILEAYRKADEEGFRGTDDASLVESMGVPVRIIQGSYENIKITTQEDLEYAEYLIARRKKQ